VRKDPPKININFAFAKQKIHYDKRAAKFLA
jgi:hypothetical protein